jgi:hypothetical protein
LGLLRRSYSWSEDEKREFMDSKELILKDWTGVALRPLDNGDQENLVKFFTKIPRTDLLI